MRHVEFDDYDRKPRAEQEDSFLGAFGNKPGSDRRRGRRREKGWNT